MIAYREPSGCRIARYPPAALAFGQFAAGARIDAAFTLWAVGPLEPADAPVHGFRLVCEVLDEERPDELPPGDPGARLATRRASEHNRRDPRLHMDQSHLPAVKHHVSRGYYVFNGTQPDCGNNAMFCNAVKQNAKTPGIWNPLPYVDTVRQDGQLGNIRPFRDFVSARRRRRYPHSHGSPRPRRVSDHPRHLITNVQTYVTRLVNQIMSGPEWNSTAIFLAWDDWDGFTTTCAPEVDGQGYGLRVAALMMISPYAKRGYIDHQVLSFDAYLKFIEDDFLGGARINPNTDGRPDSRPDARENAKILGNLVSEFDFNQKPRKPALLSLHPPYS